MSTGNGDIFSALLDLRPANVAEKDISIPFQGELSLPEEVFSALLDLRPANVAEKDISIFCAIIISIQISFD